jgi:hypothetical protein
MLTILRFVIFKLDNQISIENFLSAEIGQVANFRGLKSDQWPKSVFDQMSKSALRSPAFQIVVRIVIRSFVNTTPRPSQFTGKGQIL